MICAIPINILHQKPFDFFVSDNFIIILQMMRITDFLKVTTFFYILIMDEKVLVLCEK